MAVSNIVLRSGVGPQATIPLLVTHGLGSAAFSASQGFVSQVYESTLTGVNAADGRVTQVYESALASHIATPKGRVTQVYQSVLCSLNDAPIPVPPCGKVWPSGEVVWVSQGLTCWDSNVRDINTGLAVSGCVMGMTLSSITVGRATTPV